MNSWASNYKDIKAHEEAVGQETSTIFTSSS